MFDGDPKGALARPLRWTGNGCWALAAVIIAAVVGRLVAAREAPGVGALITPVLLLGLGHLLRLAARRLVQGDGPDLPAVDQDASQEEAAAARRAWLREHWERRPDWVAGCIRAEEERSGHLLRWAAGLWSVFALGALAAALLWGGMAWLVAVLSGVAAGCPLIRSGPCLPCGRANDWLTLRGAGNFARGAVSASKYQVIRRGIR